MSLAAFIVRYVNAADDQRVTGLQPVQVEPVPDPKRQDLGGGGGSWGLVNLEGRAGGGKNDRPARRLGGSER